MKHKLHAIATALAFFYRRKVAIMHKRSIGAHKENAAYSKLPPRKARASGKAKNIRPSIVTLSLTVVIITGGSSIVKAQKPLHIGDILPDTVWNAALAAVNQPEGKDSLRLKAYKGQLLILDFWATSCGSCIGKMPELDSLNAKYKGRLKVLPSSYQPKTKVAHFMGINPVMKNLNMESIVADSLLPALFPHQYLPHEVWIAPSGRVMAITESEYVNEQNIQAALAAEMSLNEKKDLLGFDKNKPIFNIKGFYSQLRVFKQGLRYGAGTEVDTLGQQKRYYILNAPILQLYALALPSAGLPLNPKRRILEVSDTSAYVYHPAYGYEDRWRQQHSYTYEAVMPIHTSLAEQKKQLLHTLDSTLHLKGSIAKRQVACMLLTAIAAAPPIHKGGGKLTSISLSDLLYQLNKASALPVIDATAWDQKSLLVIPEDTADMNSVLAAAGLKLSPGKRMLDMFVLRSDDRYSP